MNDIESYGGALRAPSRAGLRNRRDLACVIALLWATALTACEATCPRGSVRVGDSCRATSSGEGTAGDSSQGGGDPSMQELGGKGGGKASGGRGAQVSGSGAGRSGAGGRPGRAGDGASGIGASNTSGGGASGSGAAGDGESGPTQNQAGADAGQPEACTGEGETRCSMQGAGQRDICTDEVWQPGEACPANHVCTAPAAGETACTETVELCKGSQGKVICDAQGTMLMCNADGTVAGQQVCKSAALCEVGLAAMACPLCAAGTEHQCTDKVLEVCAPDGASFMMVRECETAALCNAVVGDCTTATCKPSAVVCVDNALATCNADGTAFEGMQPCGEGTCDEAGGDCNKCEPGQKSCEENKILTCNAAGQGHDATPCPGAEKCIGAGECVECDGMADCAGLTKDCKVGACTEQHSCAPQNAPDGMGCTTDGRPGTCSGGGCVCTKQCGSKSCGEDGCGGQCPDRCPASGQYCSGERCVDCRSDSDCDELDSDDGCVVGRCSGGSCSPSNTSARCTTDEDTAGTCRGGTCVCTASSSDCDGTCGGARDSCNEPCGRSCSSTEMCEGDRCVPRPTGDGLYESCTADGSAGPGSCQAGMVCTTFNTTGDRCWHALPCTLPETAVFDTLCAVPCTAPGTQCPASTACNNMTWCVPGVF